MGCVFQDLEPPKSLPILRKSAKILKSIRWVQFTKATLRQHDIRENKGPSLGAICPGGPHQRSPNAPKFEDGSQQETEWQERCSREAAWKLAKNILRFKEKDKSTFFLTYRGLVSPIRKKAEGKKIRRRPPERRCTC